MKQVLTISLYVALQVALLQCTLAIKKTVLAKVINVAKLNINNEIKKVEKRLEEAIISSDQTLQDASFHLLSSGEKELDPLLLF